MKKSIALFATVAAVALAAVPSIASATDFIFTFSGNGGGQGAFGTLHATDNGNGTFTATSGDITASGPVATGTGTLIDNPPLSPSGFFTYDSQLLPGQNPLISNSGLLFDIGGQEVNIFSNGPGPGTYQFYGQGAAVGAGGPNVFGNFTLSAIGAVPEPATWALMLLGFGMVGFGLRRRSKPTVRVTYA